MSIEGEQEFATDVEASIAQCFTTLVDFESYPDWFSPIQKTRVLSRYPNKLGREVEFHLDMKLRTVRYVLEYEYDKPKQLVWHSVDGDLESVVGAYDLAKVAAKRTRVTCRQRIVLGFWVPGPIRSLIERTALKQSVLEFKAAEESR
jgi:hypothetical protein